MSSHFPSTAFMTGNDFVATSRFASVIAGATSYDEYDATLMIPVTIASSDGQTAAGDEAAWRSRLVILETLSTAAHTGFNRGCWERWLW